MMVARNYFKTAVNDIDTLNDFVLTDDNLQLKTYQHDELMDFMCIKHDFDIRRIQKGIGRLDQYYKKMNIVRENTKHVHKIIHPRSENYIFYDDTLSDVEFRTSESDNDVGKDTDELTSEKKARPSKNTVRLLIK